MTFLFEILKVKSMRSMCLNYGLCHCFCDLSLVLYVSVLISDRTRTLVFVSYINIHILLSLPTLNNNFEIVSKSYLHWLFIF